MARAVAKRNVGAEILDGLRQLRRGEVGRVVAVRAMPTDLLSEGSLVPPQRV
jgi:hypothetical protein